MQSVASNVSKSSLEDPSSPTRAGVYNLHSQDSGEGQRDGQFRVNGVSRGSSELGPPEAVLNGAGVVAGEEDVDTAPLVPPKHRKPPTPPQPYRGEHLRLWAACACVLSCVCVCACVCMRVCLCVVWCENTRAREYVCVFMRVFQGQGMFVYLCSVRGTHVHEYLCACM